MYEEVKILMMLLIMNMIHWRSMCGTFWQKTKAISPFLSEESMVTGDSFLAMM